MTPLRAAVIGTGVWGRRHAVVLRALEQELGEVQLVALADLDEARVRTLGEELGVKVYTDYHHLLDREEVHAACVCTPDREHVGPALACLARELHLLIEKPLAATEEDARRIIEAARRRTGGTHRVVAVGHILRFVPQYRAAYEAVAGGRLGQVIHAYARRQSLAASGARMAGRTTLALFQAVHDLDLLRWIGGPIARVYAEGTAGHFQDRGTEDALVATLRFRSGAVGGLEVSWALPPESPSLLDQELQVVGTQGSLRVRLDGEGVALAVDGRYQLPQPFLLDAAPGALRAELLAFVRAARQGEPFPVSLEDGLEAVRLATAVDRSIATGQPIDIAGEEGRGGAVSGTRTT